MGEFDFLLCDLIQLQSLAEADGENEVVIKPMDDTAFAVFLRKKGHPSRIALCSPSDPASLYRFSELGECVLTALRLSATRRIFFD